MWRRTTTRVSLCLAAAVGCVAGPATAGAQSNGLTDLGAGYGWGLNDSGQAILSTGLYSNGKLTPQPLTALAINAAGVVAGNNSASHAAVYSNGIITDLGVLPGSNPATDYTSATAINASGQVVGEGSIVGRIDAFSYSNGTMTDLGFLPGAVPVNPLQIMAEAYGINDSGQITGIAVDGSGNYHAFIYQNGTMTDLGLGAGNAINTSGQVTGALDPVPQPATANAEDAGHAFLYANGTMTDLGVLPGGSHSTGYAINASGQIVGLSDFGAGGGGNNTHAFFYNGALTDLNALIDPTDPLKPYVMLFDARGINVNRLILANGVDSRTPNQTHAYLLQGPWIDIAPGTLSFASQPVGTASPAQSVTLTNSGASPITLGNTSVTGDFAQSSNCGSSLTAGNRCAVSITFNPTAAGNPAGTLTVVSDGAPFTIALAGIAPIRLSLSASASSVTAGMPVTLQWSVSAGASCTATGGTPADGWTGGFSGSGSRSVTEAAVGDYLYGLACTADQQTAQAQVPVLVNYPSVTVTLSVTTANSGETATLTWSSSNATSCSATGGNAGDGWAGPRATSGTAVVSEPSAAQGQSQTITFGLTCTSAQSGYSANAHGTMHAAMMAPTTSSGGGGALDLQTTLALLALGLLRAFHCWRRACRSQPELMLRG